MQAHGRVMVHVLFFCVAFEPLMLRIGSGQMMVLISADAWHTLCYGFGTLGHEREGAMAHKVQDPTYYQRGGEARCVLVFFGCRFQFDRVPCVHPPCVLLVLR